MAHTTHIPPVDLAPTGRVPALVAQAAEPARQHPEQPAGCTVWPGLCTETGTHDDHSNHQMEAADNDAPVSVGFVGLDGGEPLIYVGSGRAADCSPDEVAEVAAQLRAAADAMERMRDQVLRIQAERG